MRSLNVLFAGTPRQRLHPSILGTPGRPSLLVARIFQVVSP
jgi:hypothetical protein